MQVRTRPRLPMLAQKLKLLQMSLAALIYDPALVSIIFLQL